MRQHLGYGPLTEVEAVIRALADADEAFQAVNRAEHGFDAAESFARRHRGILRMTREAHLVFLRDGDDAIEEVRDALPVHVRGHRPRGRRRGLLRRLIVDERAVSRAAASWLGAAANDAEQRHVVLECGNTRPGRVADHRADGVDLAIALGTLP